jgi:hypothetical protein
VAVPEAVEELADFGPGVDGSGGHRVDSHTAGAVLRGRPSHRAAPAAATRTCRYDCTLDPRVRCRPISSERAVTDGTCSV